MEDHDMGMSNASTTIDPSMVQSRILQSASLAKEVTMDTDEAAVEQPTFPQLSAMAAQGGRMEYRRVRCPPHRYTPLRENWEQILTPLVDFLKRCRQVLVSVLARFAMHVYTSNYYQTVCKGRKRPM